MNSSVVYIWHGVAVIIIMVCILMGCLVYQTISVTVIIIVCKQGVVACYGGVQGLEYGIESMFGL